MITSTHTVCVVIPIYQTSLLPSEQVALDRCITVLGNHPIVVVKPENLCLGELRNRYPRVRSENFPDSFFVDIKGYNRLMLSDEFYARFSAYEFILVHQLDAFVFSDQLLNWCSRGYDYIGAPWLPDSKIPSLAARIRGTIRRKLYRMIDKTETEFLHGSTHPAQYYYAVGNGGFSLRRVTIMRSVLNALHDRAEQYRSQKRHSWAEDIFFSIEPNRFWNRMRIPNITEAAHFSWELNPSAAATLTGGKLPFGCHAWNKYAHDAWLPIFANLGYSLDELLGSHS